ncbi:hypothetical protein PLESTB_001936600 [Pleodorina starrii]|uniref:NADH dehydrogenase [ubiquinone] iron-sulfur protein 4, mitochondrial n=2 Tax=cellular organisms TaxID=131567 RepID=A0A9W6C547_9CHLO|nr:hypothetical protein PLESTB_001936600 [Pleodorina starrii]
MTSAPRPNYWILEFEPSRPPQIEPLMGHTSSDDPYRPIRLKFPDRDSAVDFAERQDWRYIIGSDRVDFWAEWCGPCKMMAPQFEAAARSLEPHVRLGKLDTEAEQQIAGRYGIRGIPTMILFRSGKEIARTSGAMPAAQIAQWARSHV